MIDLDDELATEFLAECREHLAILETELLVLERGEAEMDEERVHRAYRAVHSLKEGAGFFDLVKICELAHWTEIALASIRSHTMVLTADRVGVLLRGADKLHELIEDPGASNEADTAEILAALAGLPTERVDHRVDRADRVDRGTPADRGCASAIDQAHRGGMRLRMLLVEDDFASRLLLQTFLSRFGECHIAVNGREAVEAVRSVIERGQRYDLICMDIMMPEMDGREAVRQVRALENAYGIRSTLSAKIIMTTTVDDFKEVIRCFREFCDAYLVKPIDLAELLGHMKSYRLIQ
jgi:two-component system, chemotaxis family, chemotaxis protein CheY